MPGWADATGLKLNKINFSALHQPLLLGKSRAKLRAMLRIFLLIISLVWASLLLVSWSGPVESGVASSLDVPTVFHP